MPTRLIRVFLALAVAFVFTGRMEAAAAHCARLAEAQAPAADMHMAGMASDMPMMDHCAEMAKTKTPSRHAPSGERCECLAVLQACMTFDAESRASARIEPYDWARPEAIAFTSTELMPDDRPPRA